MELMASTKDISLSTEQQAQQAKLEALLVKRLKGSAKIEFDVEQVREALRQRLTQSKK